MNFSRRSGIFLCTFYICLLFPGICHGSLFSQLGGAVNSVLQGTASVVSGLTNALTPSGSSGVPSSLTPLLNSLGGIVNNATVVCNPLFTQFKEIGGNPSVVTKLGTVVGQYVQLEGISVVASFLRIPYAIPPLGNLRFKRAQPAVPWNGTLMANKKAAPCMQYSSNGNSSWQSPYPPTEDCLVLNVYVPKQCINLGALPVIVWIHGGSFAVGSSAIYDGSLISFLGQTIVVVMNYRLGMFGFLKADPTEAPGNMGLTDQLLAIQWVRDNIGAFNGDPNRITILGESAGAQSVSLHLISPLSRNLYQRAMMESGSMYSFIFTDNAQSSLNKTGDLARAVNCLSATLNLTTNPIGVVNCLRGIDAMTLAKAENTLRPHFGLYAQPSFGDDFLPQHPIAYYDSGNIANVPILTGNLKDEGSLFLNLGLPTVFPFSAEPNLTLTAAKSLIPLILQVLPQDIQQAASDYYLTNVPENNYTAVIEALKFAVGDLAFFCPTHFLSEKVPVTYAYWWTYLSTMTPNSKWVGVFHGSDVPYIFGFPLVSTTQYTAADTAFSTYILEEWVYFADNGIPIENANPLQGARWGQFQANRPTTFEISGIVGGDIPFPRRQGCEFWRPYFANYANYVNPIYSG